MRAMSLNLKFSSLGEAERIWTISAVNGQLERLVEIHKAIFDRFKAGDRIVYTGNYLGGENARPIETLDEILYFRRTLLALPGVMTDDCVYLRGIQEELFGKLLQIQFAPNASHVVEWMIRRHPEMGSILTAYGSSLPEAGRVAREGVVSLTRWSAFLRRQMRERPGHEMFFSVLRRAAFTERASVNDNNHNLLFVHAGIDPQVSLAEQGDSFWWSGENFNTLETQNLPFKSIVRGFDPAHQGVHIGQSVISIDGGCGYGGKLVCAHMSGDGSVMELIAA